MRSVVTLVESVGLYQRPAFLLPEVQHAGRFVPNIHRVQIVAMQFDELVHDNDTIQFSR